jgi:flagellar basal body-associated protein FliL
MAENEIIYEEKKQEKAGSKFLMYGKYFLFVVLFSLQALLAYGVVDRNYPKIYSIVNSTMKDNFVVFKMDELIVNPAGSQGQRFLVVEISLELEDSMHIELIISHMQRIKHNMIEALASKTVDQLVQFEEREKLRTELKNIVNREIGQHSVRHLYYTRYVMQ